VNEKEKEERRKEEKVRGVKLQVKAL